MERLGCYLCYKYMCCVLGRCIGVLCIEIKMFIEDLNKGMMLE